MRLSALALALIGSTAAAQTVEVLSRANPPSLLGTGGAEDVLVAPDGRTVFLTSDSAAVAGVPNPVRARRLYAYDVPTGGLSVVADFAEPRAASADGRILIVSTSNLALVPGATQVQVLAIDRATGAPELVSHSAGNPGQPVNAETRAVAASADGRFVLFDTRATDVVPGQVEPGFSTNDVFLYDRTTGLNTLVSGVGTETLGASCAAESLSPDGRWVTFRIVTSPISMVGQVLLWDRLSATFVVVSHPPGSTNGTIGSSRTSQASADGAWVVFDSTAGQILGGSGLITRSVFLYERATGLVSLVSHAAGAPGTPANGASGDARITPDGATIVYTSAATDLVAGQTDANGGADVFAFDRASGATRLLSRAVGTVATAANGVSIPASVALAAGHAVFRSAATNLVASQDDANGAPDVFAAELSADTVSLASHRTGSSLATGAAGVSTAAAASAGWVVAFVSAASDLADEPDANGAADPFLVHLGSVETRALLAQDAARLRRTGNDESTARVDFSSRGPLRHLSADGRFAVFTSEATDLVPGLVDDVETLDVFLYDRAQDAVTLVSRAAASRTTAVGGRDGRISADGRFVAFASASTAVIAGQVDTNRGADLFLFDRLTGEAQLVSHVPGAPTTTADHATGSSAAALSGDGSVIAFESAASNLVAGQVDPLLSTDVFVFERASGAVTLVSHAAGAPTQAASGGSSGPGLSPDGRFVAFQSMAADVVPGQVDPGFTADVFLSDRQTGVTTLVSHVPGSPVVTANASSGGSVVAANGRVGFLSGATDLVAGQAEGNASADLFLYERTTGAVTLVSHAAGAPSLTADAPANAFALSPSGGHVVSYSSATNLVAGQLDANGASDAFLYDAATNTSRLVSHAVGSPTTAATGGSPPSNYFEYAPPTVSADGRRVAFVSSASDLVADPPGRSSAYLFDAATDGSSVVARPPEPLAAYGEVYTPTVSADGNFVAFMDAAADLVPGDLNQRTDVFLFGPVHTSVDLRVGLADSADPVTTGRAFRYHATVANTGTTPASGVMLTVTLPAGVAFVASTPGGPVCTAAGSVVQCALGALAAGADATVDVDVAATVASGLLECGARVVANQPDSDRTDDVALETTRVDPADIGVSMDGPAAAVAAGVPFAYAIAVTNSGPAAAEGVLLTDQLPAGLTFVSSTPGAPVCTHAAGLFQCDVGTLAPAGAFAVSLQVLPAGYTSVTNEATVSADSHDPDLADNAARVTTALAPGFGLELAHGSALLRDLSPLPGPVAREDRYRLTRPPYTSWEISVDGASGDVSGAGDAIALERLGPDGTTLLQSALADGTGQTVRLRVENASETAVEDEVIRVRSTGCSSDCGSDDTYRVRARETTVTVPRFNNSATQATVLLLQNREARPLSGHAWFWSPSGTLLASRSFALAPRGSLVLATPALPGLAGASGSITVTHDGPYDALAGKAVALEPATGFAFDAPLSVRMR